MDLCNLNEIVENYLKMYFSVSVYNLFNQLIKIINPVKLLFYNAF